MMYVYNKNTKPHIHDLVFISVIYGIRLVL